MPAPTKAKAAGKENQSLLDVDMNVASHKQSTTTATKRVASNANSKGKKANGGSSNNNKGKKTAAAARGESVADEDDVGSAREQDDEVVEETQEDDADSGMMQVDEEAAATKKQKKSSKGKKNVAAQDDEAAEEGESVFTPRERRLQAKLEFTQKALKEQQEAFKKLSELRHTKAEESEKQLIALSSQRTDAAAKLLEQYKSDANALRAEVADMKANGFQPSIPSPSAERLAELESSLEQARAETDELRAKVVELESKAEAAANAEREMVKRDRKWEKELAKTVAAKDEEAAKSMATLKLELAAKVNELQTARQELAAEVEHSKSLQAKVKNSVAAPSSSATAGSDSKLAKLTEEYRRLEMHRNLGEDLTGFAVVSNKSEDAGEVYNCILNDCLGVVGGLNFKLTFHPDETVSYVPDVDAERDPALAQLLPQEMQRYMRFDATQCSEFFQTLFCRLNPPK